MDLEVQGFVIWSLNFIDEVYHTLRETKNTLRGLTPKYHLKKIRIEIVISQKQQQNKEDI